MVRLAASWCLRRAPPRARRDELWRIAALRGQGPPHLPANPAVASRVRRPRVESRIRAPHPQSAPGGGVAPRARRLLVRELAPPVAAPRPRRGAPNKRFSTRARLVRTAPARLDGRDRARVE